MERRNILIAGLSGITFMALFSYIVFEAKDNNFRASRIANGYGIHSIDHSAFYKHLVVTCAVFGVFATLGHKICKEL